MQLNALFKVIDLKASQQHQKNKLLREEGLVLQLYRIAESIPVLRSKLHSSDFLKEQKKITTHVVRILE